MTIKFFAVDSADNDEISINQEVYVINFAPVAVDDSYSVDEDNILTIDIAAGVLNNDTDQDSDPLTAVLDTNTSHGILNLNSDGSFTYTPEFNYNGPDSFTYKANDGNLDSNIATVSITVNAIILVMPVIWTDLVGVSVTGSTITKTAGTGWGNSGAASTQTISADGGVQFTALENNRRRRIGLSTTNPDANMHSIEYGIQLRANKKVQVKEFNNVNRGIFGTYQSGDVFAIERTGTTVVYKKNGTVFYTSTAASSGALLVDVAFYTNGATIMDALIR